MPFTNPSRIFSLLKCGKVLSQILGVFVLWWLYDVFLVFLCALFASAVVDFGGNKLFEIKLSFNLCGALYFSL